MLAYHQKPKGPNGGGGCCKYGDLSRKLVKNLSLSRRIIDDRNLRMFACSQITVSVFHSWMRF
jgi:hypothetical protein